MTNKEAIIKACVTPEMKAKAKAILKDVGLTPSKFMRLTFEQLIKAHEIHGGSLLIVRLPQKKDNQNT